MKILVIQKKFMGDVLICSVVFELLKKKFPNAEIHYLIDPKHEPIVKHHRFIDKILHFEGFLAMFSKVRKEKYDIIIDTYSKVGTALLCGLSGAEKTCSYHKKYTSFLYTFPIHRSEKAKNKSLTSAIEHRIELLAPFGIEMQEQFPKIYLSEEEKQDAETLLQHLNIKNDKPLIMLSLFGSSDEKSYPLVYFNDILKTIKKHTEAQILCNYLPNQKEKFEAWYQSLPQDLQEMIVKDFDTKNLRQYIVVVARCKALIGNEGGSTNISKALDVPTFSIFAPFVNKHSWDWKGDDFKNVSVHCNDYQVSDYEAFKPTFFQDKLIDFLKNNIENQ